MIENSREMTEFSWIEVTVIINGVQTLCIVLVNYCCYGPVLEDEFSVIEF